LNVSQFGERNAAQFTPAYFIEGPQNERVDAVAVVDWCKTHPTSDRRPPLDKDGGKVEFSNQVPAVRRELPRQADWANPIARMSASADVSVIRTYLA
jgi:hypothetical protein